MGTLSPMTDVRTLIIVRHGQSEWNETNLFSGWVDVELTEKGRAEAVHAGDLYTSLLTRAIDTAHLALKAAGRQWIDERRSWRLNERHYGDLQGKNKAEVRDQYGEEQFKIWRRSYDTPPLPIADDAKWSQFGDARYADLGDDIPRTECLKDVLARMLPYWEGEISNSLHEGKQVLIAAHGNSLRALVKHLDGISDDDIVGVNIPTGIPRVYKLDPETLKPVEPAFYLDPEAAAAGAAAVAAQGSK